MIKAGYDLMMISYLFLRFSEIAPHVSYFLGDGSFLSMVLRFKPSVLLSKEEVVATPVAFGLLRIDYSQL